MKTNILFFGLILGIIGISQSQTARLQVIHNSADAAASVVDVYLNGVMLIDDFEFRTASPFIDAPAGVPLSIDIAPASSISVTESIANFQLTLAANETYVVVANGIVSASGYSPATPFNLHVLPEAREFAADMNTVDVVVFHGVTDAPDVDVVETAFNAGTLVDDLAYSVFSNYLELDVENYAIDVRTADQSATVASYSVPLESLNLGGVAITVIASGFLNPANNSNGSSFGLWVALPSGGNLVSLPVTTSIEEQASIFDNISVYPNPVSDYLVIELPQTENMVSLQMTDMIGNTIMQTQLNGYNSIDVSYLSQGTYFLKFNSLNSTHVEKIIITN